jgi:hypothetical protein
VLGHGIGVSVGRNRSMGLSHPSGPGGCNAFLTVRSTNGRSSPIGTGQAAILNRDRIHSVMRLCGALKIILSVPLIVQSAAARWLDVL